MGLMRRLVQRMHKLRDEVRDRAKDERVEKKDEILNSSPGAYALKRGIRRRQAEDFGQDSLNRKLELAWEVDVAIERIDFGVGDNGLRITLPSSAQLLARGFKAGDELKILEEGSALAGLRFEAVEEANSGDVAAGYVRLVDSTTWRLPDDAAWVDESSVRIRVELGAGVR